jgi:hypothetical protein
MRPSHFPRDSKGGIAKTEAERPARERFGGNACLHALDAVTALKKSDALLEFAANTSGPGYSAQRIEVRSQD